MNSYCIQQLVMSSDPKVSRILFENDDVAYLYRRSVTPDSANQPLPRVTDSADEIFHAANTCIGLNTASSFEL